MKNTQIIKKKDLQLIYKLVCQGWQKTIAEIVLFQEGSDIEVENSLIEKAYEEANDDQKKLILKYFKLESEDKFSVTTYKEVCKRLKIKELTIKDFDQFGEEAIKQFAFHQIKNLERFFNRSWVADWKNQFRYKWYPYFTINGSGGLKFFGVHYSFSHFAGSVGYYKDKKTAKHIGTTPDFIKIYEKLM